MYMIVIYLNLYQIHRELNVSSGRYTVIHFEITFTTYKFNKRLHLS